MASRWPPNGTKNAAPRGSKMDPKRTSGSRPISYPVLPPFRAPAWGRFGAPLGTSWSPFGRPNPKERLRDAILTCSFEHLEEELRRTSPKWRNGPQVGPNLTAARLLKSSKSCQNPSGSRFAEKLCWRVLRSIAAHVAARLVRAGVAVEAFARRVHVDEVLVARRLAHARRRSSGCIPCRQVDEAEEVAEGLAHKLKDERSQDYDQTPARSHA